MTTDRSALAFLGFGEAAQAFATGFQSTGARAYDIKTDGSEAAAKRAEYAAHSIVEAATCADACASADIVFSMVTADQAEVAAATAGQSDLNGAFFFDCNSCAPDTKRRSARLIEAAGGRYVDVAIMTPVHPKLHKSPCLIAGPHADAAHSLATGLGMNVGIAGDEIGAASIRKMIRSIMVKGLEALTLECFLAAQKGGIQTELLASLETSYAGFDWTKRAPYMMERAATHGIRRAA